MSLSQYYQESPCQGYHYHTTHFKRGGGSKVSENSATKKHIQCMFIEKEHLGFLWFEIILYKQRLIELFGSYVLFNMINGLQVMVDENRALTESNIDRLKTSLINVTSLITSVLERLPPKLVTVTATTGAGHGWLILSNQVFIDSVKAKGPTQTADDLEQASYSRAFYYGWQLQSVNRALQIVAAFDHFILNSLVFDWVQYAFWTKLQFHRPFTWIKRFAKGFGRAPN
ncbi:hypothetical protein PROFUN_15011 [Planoprotostelium fungivorum]|uniref:Uncharacterized protein n=1 Tax=Planoprotostelium fungivorum TaxID=1890364 RepID=A0A2P6MY19_9EUKA|nr:hypothetical protein PROFUN_15011 [Planoprotostelium fungivorum]